MPGERILLLDTEKNVLLAYRTVLEDEGYLVSIASNKNEALEKIATYNFAVLITELYLKGENTFSIIKEFKEQTPQIYVILTTAVSLTPENHEEIINAGVEDFFTKPLSTKLLLATIKKGLKRRLLISNYLSIEKRLKNIENSVKSTYINNLEQGKIIADIGSFVKILQNEIVRSERYNHTFSLILLETKSPENETLDFTNENNNQIHNKMFHLLTSTTRKTDFVTGYNGNYALILVETPEDGTKTFTTRLQKNIINVYHNNKLQSQKLTSDMKIDCIAFPGQTDRIYKYIDTTNGEQTDQQHNSTKK